jgi:hypothetical protein
VFKKSLNKFFPTWLKTDIFGKHKTMNQGLCISKNPTERKRQSIEVIVGLYKWVVDVDSFRG